DVVLGAPADPQFEASWEGAPQALEVEPGATPYVVTFEPTFAGEARAFLPFEFTGHICSAPKFASLVGRGIKGDFAVSADIDFGLTHCGETAPSFVVSLQNFGDAPIQLTKVELRKGDSSLITIATPPTPIPAKGNASS